MRLAKAWPEGPLVFGHDKEIAEFVRQRIPNMGTGFGDCTAIGVIRNKKLLGGVVYHEHQPQYKTIMVSYAFDSPAWAMPAVLGSICAYPFIQLGCNRMTTLVPKKNKRSRRFIEGTGFKLEGCIRKGYGNDDMMIYGMMARHCRWIEE